MDDTRVLRLPVDHLDGPLGNTKQRDSKGHLRAFQVVLDVVSVTVGWAIIFSIPAFYPKSWSLTSAAVLLTAIVAVHICAIAGQNLYLARVSAVRSVEVARVFRSGGIAAIGGILVAALLNISIYVWQMFLGAALATVILAVVRGIYSSWIRTGRAHGLYGRPVVIIGTNREAEHLAELLETHGELGLRVRGAVGDRDELATWKKPVDLVGSIDDATEALSRAGAKGAIIAATALTPERLNKVSRELLRADCHVHISSGLSGIDHRRIRPLPLAYEPLFYLEKVRFKAYQAVLKRIMDVVVASAMIVLTSPILLMSALAVKLNDGGPVLFRQQRVGRYNELISVWKFRTMVPNAESLLADVRENTGNGRDNVLFKLKDDPRRTKVGRILESTSIDELPQLFNVIAGTMSLVGPRPALPSEVDEFDNELLARLTVPPGITGLWQVEARDNPAFDAYRRLDLFYVENWSLSLDVVLIFETISSVIARLIRR